MNKKTNNLITQKYLKEILEYDNQTNEFIWKVAKNNRSKVGSKAGTLRKDGYTRIMIDGSLYYSHRLAWLYHFGVFPAEEIDHLDGNPANNRLENLREVSHSENSKNHKRQSNNTSGITGIRLHRVEKKSGKIFEYFDAVWIDLSGNTHHKLFPISRHGYDQARELAINYRHKRIQELNTQGAGYTERHGN